MTLLAFANHLLNFALPALGTGLLMVLLCRLAMRKQSLGRPLLWQWAMQSLAGCVVLVVGLLVFGADGRMATYAALVVVCGSLQWALLRGWRH